MTPNRTPNSITTMSELKNKRIWTHTIDKTPGKHDPIKKRPFANVAAAKNWNTYEIVKNLPQMQEEGVFAGIKTSWGMGFIVLDIDVKENEEIPPDLIAFLTENKTYVEYSPSGNGLHVIYSLDKETRALAKNNVSKLSMSTDDGHLFNGDIRFNNQFVTITGNTLPMSTDEIAVIGLDHMKKLTLDGFQALKTGSKTNPPGKGDKKTLKINPALAFGRDLDVDDFRRTLDTIPPQFNDRIKDAYARTHFKNIPQDTRSHWVEIGLLTAHEICMFILLEENEKAESLEEIFINWAKKDTEKFQNEAVERKNLHGFINATMSKLSSLDDPFSARLKRFASLKKLSHCLRYAFPDLNTKGNAVKTSVDNMKYLMKVDGIEFMRSTMGGVIYIKAPKEILNTFFKTPKGHKNYVPPGYSQGYNYNVLKDCMIGYLQNRYKDKKLTGTHVNAAISGLMPGLDRISPFLSAVKEKLDYCLEHTFPKQKQACVEYCRNLVLGFTQTLVFDPERMPIEGSESFFKLCMIHDLFSIVGVHMYPEDRPSIIRFPIFSGPQGCGKTKWGEYLLPNKLITMFEQCTIKAFLAAHKSLEHALLMTQHIIAEVTEIEKILGNIHEFKGMIDKRIVQVRFLYESIKEYLTRITWFYGTTNETTLNLTTKGTRKIVVYPLLKCDWIALKKMDMLELYAAVFYLITHHKQETIRLCDECNKKTTCRLCELEPLCIEMGYSQDRKLDIKDFSIQDLWNMTPEMIEMNETLNLIVNAGTTKVFTILNILFGSASELKFNPDDYTGQKRAGTKNVSATVLKEPPKSSSFDTFTIKDKVPYVVSVRYMYEFLKNYNDGVFGHNISVQDVEDGLTEWCTIYTKTNTGAAKNKRPFKDKTIVITEGSTPHPNPKRKYKLYFIPHLSTLDGSKDIKLSTKQYA